MARWLKEGISEATADEADARVRETVAGILDDVRRRGETAVRELSERRRRPAHRRLRDQECHRGLTKAMAVDLVPYNIRRQRGGTNLRRDPR